ncbi:type IV secretion protein Rhs [Salmonella enterica subsp. enterica serovar Typhimurium]|uniref:polymorphic toxin type 47 domain-containing protein n=1 Tax=Salmonella enterica TaxID=28901 RepID=UPI0009AD5FF7|nr:polymorphic toxin type 47 domain-containing protein [Salmonella enterica]EBY6763290.1 type IV secretion protein Rhs [Salmonella enterica subsp. enterica serovar Typhimurium]EEJ6423226.1 type IV secretion protein Rhs [Salmonella enterica subsp. enterica]ECN0598666.1 type IV secretion protein Rhs [Salmonella enterica subsp. enterica serovar Typhimurium]ECN3957470.1 type IV secretion protein Rhs [Salmonella enterica subsp. enterica serovar Typhimurium]ECN4386042.1 type IV secretion protein Rhs
MYEAARVDDPIYHTSALAGFLIGAIIGIAIIALAAFAFFSCGFLAGLILGFMADQIASGVLQLGEAIGRSIHHTAGKILTGSENVSTNSRPAARAVLSTVKCDNHIAEKRIAQGSENIYINSQPAARKDDHTECDAVIEDGSPNVFLGGGTQTVLEISSEIPDWLRKVVDVLFVVASLLGGLAGAWRQAAKLGTKFGTKCAAKFIGGELVGMAVGEAISGLFSNPVDVTTGQKILLPETDFTLPGRLPVTCSRFYASHLETVGLLGRGWRLNWETSLRDDDEHITLTGVQGRELRYPKTMLTPGHQIFDPEEQLYLSRLHDGRYVLHYTDRSYYVFGDFDSDGMAYLLFMETPHRQRIVFGHEGGRLVRIASSSGHHLLLHRTQTPAGERLSRIELVQGGTRGNLVEYRYDDNGQLTGVVNRAGTQVRQFAYENGLMTAHSNATGFTCRYRWQELDGAPRVTEHDTSDGEHYRFDYDFAAGTTTVTGRQGETWQWWYDRETYITAHRTPGGGMYRFTYNEDHFPVNIELPGGRTVAYEYDIQNRVVKTTDPEGRVTQTQWNGEFDEITRTALDDDAVWKTQYNAHGQPVQETDPEGRVTQYAYDEQGQMCSRTDAAGGTQGGVRRETQQRDALGRLLRTENEHGQRTFSYNRLDQITAVTLTPTEAGQQQHRMQADTVRFEYDRSGWLTAEHAGNGSICYQRDALGNPTDITLPDGQHLTHLYYGSGHLLQTALDGLTVSEYERDSLHRQIMRTQGQLATYSGYDDDGLLSWQRSLASGSAPVLPGQRPARQGCVTSRDYYWNNHGEVGTIDDGLRGSVVYSYDRSGYLTGRSGQMYDHDRYYYDKAGNLLDNEGQGAVMSNRLPGCGRDRYGYNEWGELTTRRDQQLEWNAQGQLTRVISGNTETHYGYDALGRRTRKATYGRHTGHTARSRTDFVWEGFRLLQENVQQQGWRTYLYDAEQPYTPVASVTGKGESRQVWYYHTDVTGTPQEVTAADGTLVWAGYIRGFGENAADISNSGAYFHQPLRLPGQYFDDETGLHYNLFRYYAPECGRFVSQDPIGLAGGLNLYQYAPNPIRWIDPLGLAILEHQSNFDAARRTGFENAGMTNPEDVTFSKVDPKTGTVVEFKGPNGAKVAYDAPHADMDVTAGHDKPHVGWQSAGKRGSGGANRGNITYDGPQHPHRSDSKGDDKC